MRIVASLIVGLATLLASVGALSHHSFSAEFDVGRPVTLEGTVKEMEWTNPHAWIHLVVEDEQGNAQEWAVELLGVNSLIRSGMSPKTVVPGDRLTISGFGARNGTNTANASTVTRTGSAESLWTSVRE
jgi:hypothetical protein